MIIYITPMSTDINNSTCTYLLEIPDTFTTEFNVYLKDVIEYRGSYDDVACIIGEEIAQGFVEVSKIIFKHTVKESKNGL
jgi:hypothetical protein